MDFAPRRVWTAPLIGWAVLCGIGTATLCLMAGVAWEARQAAAESAAQSQSNLALLDQSLRDARMAAATQKPPAYARDALEAARVAGFPTQAVLRSLEATASDGIRITSIALQPAQGSAEVALEFSDYEMLLKYIEQLNEGEPQARWMLVRAQTAAGKKLAVIRYVRGG
ncbi:hypothetical protein OU995_23275 [Roseateles sp. SL47]|uniref:hypothetical protein n=1 Tax=Roseateles sp. SL47 TaxID=2995138 RepID=UPI00226E8C01|nr:hypothetical protein [Roseateles sp. SL47]WAC72443.1 hypothetical protein OU995_23275 [Roseateles sp. SL47]